MRAIRNRITGCRHGRLVSLKRRYSPGFEPRHAKPVVEDAVVMELAA